MPYYIYQCNRCLADVEMARSISERDAPLSEPCQACEATGTVTRKVASPLITSGTPDHIGSKVPAGFREKLKEMKKNAGKHSTIQI